MPEGSRQTDLLEGLSPGASLERWPRLSQTLRFGRRLDQCQGCGRPEEEAGGVTRWMEHGDQDQSQPIVVVLCTSCSGREIERHPRLYRALQEHEPMPGAMPICVGCERQVELRCTSPVAQINGGPGLSLTFPAPSVAFFDGTRNGRRAGWRKIVYTGPVESCSGWEAKT